MGANENLTSSYPEKLLDSLMKHIPRIWICRCIELKDVKLLTRGSNEFYKSPVFLGNGMLTSL